MKQKLTVLIGDDCARAASELARWLSETGVVRVGKTYEDARSLASGIATEKPGAVIVDSNLPPFGAFSLSDAIEPRIRPRMIVASDDPEDAIRAFEIRAFHFLRKPWTRERVTEAILLAHTHLLAHEERHQPNRRIAVRHGTRTLLLKLRDIDWIEAAGNYVRIHVGDRSWLLRETMTGIESRLPREQFVRIQRSVVVNLERVDAIRNGRKDDLSVLLNDATELPLSRTYRESFEIAMGM